MGFARYNVPESMLRYKGFITALFFINTGVQQVVEQNVAFIFHFDRRF
jgi:hypothetical protein